MKAKLTTSVYCLVMGILNIITWSILILTQQVPNIRQDIISLSFHWISEFAMALTMIIAGSLIFKQHRRQRPVFYFGSGMLLLAILGASIYYSVHFDLIVFSMSLLITSFTIIFIWLHYQKFTDFYYLSLGTIIYGAINILGNMIQKMELANVVYISLPLFLSILLVVFSLGGEIK